MPHPIFRSNELNSQDKEIELIGFRLGLLEKGYQPIPIRDKRTWIKGWTTRVITLERIAEETILHPDHLSTGLRTGELVGVDIDLRDPDHAEIIRVLTEDTIGETPLRRRGSKGYMLCYRNTDTPIGKTTIRDAATASTLIEIFGQGGQFVAYGIHPTTQQPYRWLVPGQEPATVPLTDLPTVSNAGLAALHDVLMDGLAYLGYPVEKTTATVHTEPLRVGRISDIQTGTVTEMFLNLMPNRVPSSSGYINMPCPYCRHHDNRSGFMIRPNGGFYYHCFHAGCLYHANTGWSPGGHVGPKARELYARMGGNPDDLRQRPQHHTHYTNLAELLMNQEVYIIR
jgi:hypothetical protein